MKKLVNTIYLGDTLDLMKKISNKSIDLIITDPPYGMNYHGNRRKEKADQWGKIDKKFDHIKNDSGEEFEELLINYIKECHRIMKDNTAMYMFCSWHKVGFFQQELEKLFTLKNLIVWNKNNHTVGDLFGSYAPKHELIWFTHKGRSLMRGKRYADVIDCAKVYKPVHPTMKPIEILQKFVTASSDEGDLVFDGFMGSGSTAIAAANMNRKYIGAELEPNYHKIASDAAAEAGNTASDIFG